ncbi:MAG: 50S ribosomal protein L10 [Chlamydiia bacterium]|nr:50S ribosomal protein L10 [Chlamydiia bacterium]
MRQEKQLLLDELKDKISDSGSFVFTRYEKLSANQANDFRGILAKVGGELEVVRKRVLIKAALAAGVELDLKMLEGHVGVVFSGDDAVVTAKTIIDFSKDSNDSLKILGGFFDGKLCDAQQVDTLSKLPGKDEMRAQFLGLLEAPMAQTLAVMEALLCSVPYCLDNKISESGDN